MKEPSPIHIREAWLLCFLLGVIMLNYPFIHIFNKDALTFGIPTLFLYLIVGWPTSIVVIYLFSKTLANEKESGGPKDGKENDR